MAVIIIAATGFQMLRKAEFETECEQCQLVQDDGSVRGESIYLYTYLRHVREAVKCLIDPRLLPDIPFWIEAGDFSAEGGDSLSLAQHLSVNF